jgi:hypothetical protein
MNTSLPWRPASSPRIAAVFRAVVEPSVGFLSGPLTAVSAEGSTTVTRQTRRLTSLVGAQAAADAT